MKKKHKATETSLKALGVGLITAGVSWVNTEPLDGIIGITLGVGCLYTATHYRNIKMSISQEEAEEVIDKTGDYIREKIDSKNGKE